MRRCCVALIGMLFFCGSIGAQPYAINLDRPFHQGQRINLFGSVEESTEATVLKSEKTTESGLDFSIRGVLTVQAVDGRGAISKAMLRVASAEITRSNGMDDDSDSKTTHPLAEGTTIVAEWIDGAEKITLNKGKLTPEMDRLLQMVIPVRGPDEPGFDDLIGTDKPQSKGDAWAVNVDNISKLLARNGVKVAKGQIRLTGSNGKSAPVADLQLVSPDCTRAQASLELLDPRLEELTGDTIHTGSGVITIASVQSWKVDSEPPVNQYVNWRCTNEVTRGGLRQTLLRERNCTIRFEPFDEPANNATRKRRRN